MTDLKHWDLVDQLTIGQIARLAAGIEPDVRSADLAPEVNAKVGVIQRQLEASYQNAWQLAMKMTAGLTSPEDHPWTFAEDLLPPSKAHEALVSWELERACPEFCV